MTREIKEVINPVTGERIVFQVPSDRKQPLLFDDHWTRPGHRLPAHVHPEMSERWHILAGEVVFRIDGIDRKATAGDIVNAPAGTPHMAWMTSEEPVFMQVVMDPALMWPEFTDELFRLAALGRTDESGLPPDDELARLLHAYPREIAAPRWD